MNFSETNDLRSLANRKAVMIRCHGAEDPRSIRAARELAAAHLAAALARARASGLDELDVMGVVLSGTLPAEASAA